MDSGTEFASWTSTRTRKKVPNSPAGSTRPAQIWSRRGTKSALTQARTAAQFVQHLFTCHARLARCRSGEQIALSSLFQQQRSSRASALDHLACHSQPLFQLGNLPVAILQLQQQRQILLSSTQHSLGASVLASAALQSLGQIVVKVGKFDQHRSLL
uniref:Uncharacterized protein n=1 Tax=Pseudomonas aeruginosa TaxID=287 RepID=B3G279_PSEAI|nr:hypothetical protein PACL_0353 [Pseudomonas aeruginosa]